ncbi:bifunctional indole-3-glycerol-phosphate synthase TrpC/phosphoribosylanthranilate isomerase TrpF [Actinomycetaceae bacterium TAE3-ERU4]|nr:bifunctional indole-3-glycerol-phosphate synthase TrpC/phosphoribosylanthranilate isomerase TrpF [Actinomycetaceae bacterium TAE3-ERU4]
MNHKQIKPFNIGTEPGTVLDKIVARRKTHLPGIRAQIEGITPDALPPSERSLYSYLGEGKRGENHYLMECKAASPSLGLIRESYNPAEIAGIYSRYAAGISVLCEPDFFGGSYDHLATVAESTHLPVLCKDFIIDPIQILAARYYGADAILLMLSVLKDEEYRLLADLAQRLKLDVLTEVSTREELSRALKLKAKIIGINNRNLRNLSIDTARTRELAPQIPNDTVVLSESGIRSHNDVVELGRYVSGFLVGSSLTSQKDIDLACRNLLYGNVKICGITSASQAQAATTAGASYGGIIRAAKSPRYLQTKEALEIITEVPALKWVAVTTEEEAAKIVDKTKELLPYLEAIQVHTKAKTGENGKYSPQKQTELLQEIRQLLDAQPGGKDTQIWLGLSANRPADLEACVHLATQVRIVLDSGDGGTGISFDWGTIPETVRPHIFLAGGIGEHNIAEASKQKTYGLDLNSALEYPKTKLLSKPQKDPVKMKNTLRKIRRNIA